MKPVVGVFLSSVVLLMSASSSSYCSSNFEKSLLQEFVQSDAEFREIYEALSKPIPVFKRVPYFRDFESKVNSGKDDSNITLGKADSSVSFTKKSDDQATSSSEGQKKGSDETMTSTVLYSASSGTSSSGEEVEAKLLAGELKEKRVFGLADQSKPEKVVVPEDDFVVIKDENHSSSQNTSIMPNYGRLVSHDGDMWLRTVLTISPHYNVFAGLRPNKREDKGIFVIESVGPLYRHKNGVQVIQVWLRTDVMVLFFKDSDQDDWKPVLQYGSTEDRNPFKHDTQCLGQSYSGSLVLDRALVELILMDASFGFPMHVDLADWKSMFAVSGLLETPPQRAVNVPVKIDPASASAYFAHVADCDSHAAVPRQLILPLRDQKSLTSSSINSLSRMGGFFTGTRGIIKAGSSLSCFPGLLDNMSGEEQLEKIRMAGAYNKRLGVKESLIAKDVAMVETLLQKHVDFFGDFLRKMSDDPSMKESFKEITRLRERASFLKQANPQGAMAVIHRLLLKTIKLMKENASSKGAIEVFKRARTFLPDSANSDRKPFESVITAFYDGLNYY